MSDTIIVSMITSLTSFVIAVVGFVLSYNKTKAETAILRSQLNQTEEKNQRQFQELSLSTQELKQTTSYKNYKRAFQELEENIRIYLDKCKADNVTSLRIDLKLIAVAMTFSWDNFIITEIPDLLKSYPDLTINLDIVFVNHIFLENQPIGHGDIDWVKKSKDRIIELQEFHTKYKKQYSNRLNLRAKIYSNLPHWHGWLFNDDHLFLGRTSWNIEKDGQPILKVGQNKYRHFSNPRENDEALERIELFKSWHQYYFDFSSEWVIGNKT